MVDPKRHINILSPKEQSFLEECENEFANRFTDLDEEFMAHCQQPSKPPPIVHPWNVRRGGGVWRGHGGDHRFGDRGGRGTGAYRFRPYNNRGYRRNNYRDKEHYHGARDGSTSDSRSNYRSGDRRYDREANR